MMACWQVLQRWWWAESKIIQQVVYPLQKLCLVSYSSFEARRQSSSVQLTELLSPNFTVLLKPKLCQHIRANDAESKCHLQNCSLELQSRSSYKTAAQDLREVLCSAPGTHLWDIWELSYHQQQLVY